MPRIHPPQQPFKSARAMEKGAGAGATERSKTTAPSTSLMMRSTGGGGGDLSYHSESDEDETSYGSSDSDSDDDSDSSYESDSDDSDSDSDEEDGDAAPRLPAAKSLAQNEETLVELNDAPRQRQHREETLVELNDAMQGLSNLGSSASQGGDSGGVRRNLSGGFLDARNDDHDDGASHGTTRSAGTLPIPSILSVPNFQSMQALDRSQRQCSNSGVTMSTAMRRSSGGVLHIEQGAPTASAVSHGTGDSGSGAAATEASSGRSPAEQLRSILNDRGYSGDPFVQAADPRLLPSSGYTIEHTPAQIAAYDTAVVGAVRSGNLAALRSMVDAGRDLQCSNRFGESIVHAACRRGSVDVVRFLLDEAGVSLRVRDDQGRTPLHDACWTRVPEFELVRMILEREPDLLLVCDKRGHSPLGYVRRDDWGAWVRFLEEHRELVVPKVLLSVGETTQC